MYTMYTYVRLPKLQGTPVASSKSWMTMTEYWNNHGCLGIHQVKGNPFLTGSSDRIHRKQLRNLIFNKLNDINRIHVKNISVKYLYTYACVYIVYTHNIYNYIYIFIYLFIYLYLFIYFIYLYNLLGVNPVKPNLGPCRPSCLFCRESFSWLPGLSFSFYSG